MSTKETAPKNKRTTARVLVILGIIFLAIFFTVGFSALTVILIILRLIFLFYLLKSLIFGATISSIIGTGIVLTIISIVMISYLPSSGNNKLHLFNNTNSGDILHTNKHQLYILNSADNKIEGIVDIVKIKKNKNKGKYIAYYQIFLKDTIYDNHCENNMSKEFQCGDDEIHMYDYSAQFTNDKSVTSLHEVYCNAELPSDNFQKSYNIDFQYSQCHDTDEGRAHTTEIFYIFDNIIFDSFQEFLDTNTITLYDASKSFKPNEKGGYSLYPKDAVKKSNKYKTYSFELHQK